ncbi:hypothetical protein FQN57_005171 [Myotisia sp. PD_48]|nr:hypothetical protein FQN57_005171 [Myotisia sp. PD_48]
MEPAAAGHPAPDPEAVRLPSHPAWLDDASPPRIAHTLTACRKSKCTPGLPKCEPCRRTNSNCEYYDYARQATVPRTYISDLRDKIRALAKKIEDLENEIDTTPDAEVMARRAGLIRFTEADESRFLGPSSGIAITRFVIEMAKQNTDTKSIKEVVNDHTIKQVKSVFRVESRKPTSKVYPMISSVAAESLPTPDLTGALVELFMRKSQYMLPILHEPTFRQEIDAVYNGSQDPCQNFQLRLVIAISMQKIDTRFAGLADSFYLAALPYLDNCIKRMDVSTLQCFALMALYSLLTPTRTAAYWVVGVAVKLCQELGLTNEDTIGKAPNGQPLDCLAVDMRRRLFWIITSLEYGLSHSLGRPSAFSFTHDHIDVKFFEMVDDHYITPDGVLPDGLPIMKKCIAIHFFKMRILQAEIRRRLYLRKRSTPVDNQDPWFTQMLDKLDRWVENCPRNDEGSGLSELWFHGRRNTMIVFMFRPSPQIPEPSLDAARRCYKASIFNVKMHLEQVETKSVDLTWIFTQSVFMALNTILWSLSYPEIRQENSREDVMYHIGMATKVLAVSSERWPGVESALRLYNNLIDGCLKAYSSDESYVVHSPPSNRPSPGASHEYASPSPASNSSNNQDGSSPLPQHSPSLSTHVPSPYYPRSIAATSDAGLQSSPGTSHHSNTPLDPLPPPPPPPPSSRNTYDSASPDTAYYSYSNNGDNRSHRSNSHIQLPPITQIGNTSRYMLGPELQNTFDPHSIHNALPSISSHDLRHLDPSFDTFHPQSNHSFQDFGSMAWMNQYSQFYNQPYQPSHSLGERTLSRPQQQAELMDILMDDLPNISQQLGNDSSTFYSNGYVP